MCGASAVATVRCMGTTAVVLVLGVLGGSGFAWAVLTGLARIESRYRADMQRAMESRAEPMQGGDSARLEALERLVHETLAETERLWHETRKLDGRARYAVRSHLAKLEELGVDPTDLVETASRELRLVDGSGSDDEGMLAVPEDVEGFEAAPDDWRAAAMRHKYGS